MTRRAAAVAICAVLGALAAGAPVGAHYSLPGGKKCGAIAVQQNTDFAAFDIKVKRISCRRARPSIRAIALGNSTSFDCKVRGRQSGDAQNGIAHTDYSCRKPAQPKPKRIVFAAS